MIWVSLKVSKSQRWKDRFKKKEKGLVVVNKEEEEVEGEVGGGFAKVTRGKNSLFLFALLFFAMMFLNLVMDVLEHKGGGRTTRTMWATRRRWTPRRWTSRRWSQRV